MSMLIKTKKASSSLSYQSNETVEKHKKNRGYFLRFAPQAKFPKGVFSMRLFK